LVQADKLPSISRYKAIPTGKQISEKQVKATLYGTADTT
jgi:hypothetical protein